MYDEVLRVPLLIGAAGVRPRRIGADVELVDVFPTIADARQACRCRRRCAARAWCRSSPARATERSRPYAFHMRFFFENDGSTHWLSVRDREWKLLAKTPDHAPTTGRRDGTSATTKTYYELYRTSDDPGEQHDQYEAHPEQVDRLRGVFEERTRSLKEKPARVEPDDATREHLRALGYE